MSPCNTYELGNIIEISDRKYDPQKDTKNYPCIELEHIEQFIGQINGYTDSKAQKSIKNIFTKGSVLYGKLRPYLRKYYLAELDGVCSTEIWVLNTLDDQILRNEYLYYLVQTDKFNRYANVSSGSKMPRADWNYISQMTFDIPEVGVQEKIINIITLWDKAIKQKDNLIKQTYEMKKALMQRLLTCKLRLPGFNGLWKEVKLGDVFKERKETGYTHLELLAITSNRGVVKRDEVEIKDNSSEDKSKYKRICPLDIGYNTMRMWQGVSGVSKYEGIVSPAYTILSPTSFVDSYFMSYLFKLPKVINLFWRYSQGLVDDTLNLKYENFKKIRLNIPIDINEQRAIAKLLKIVDEQIVLQEKELEQLKLQKKGLVELLLMGKVRVKC